MTDRLKKRFEEIEQEDFLLEEPLPGHRERFKKRLLDSHELESKPRQWPLWSLIAVAACFCGVIITLVYFNIEKENTVAQTVELSDISTEMDHLESYFASEIDVRKKNVDFSDPEIKVHVDKFLFLEQEYQDLVTALNDNYGNEHVISAMIENYQLRLKVLEQIKRHIEIQNDKKLTNHDTSDINT
jgi:hypothetical protein